MVDPDWQGAGLGSILHAGLVEYAREHGARGLTADVLPGNSRMMRVFERGDRVFPAGAGIVILSGLYLFQRERATQRAAAVAMTSEAVPQR